MFGGVLEKIYTLDCQISRQKLTTYRPYRNSASNDFRTLYPTCGVPRVNYQL